MHTAQHTLNTRAHHIAATVMEQRQAGCSVSKQWVWVPIRLGSTKCQSTNSLTGYIRFGVDETDYSNNYANACRTYFACIMEEKRSGTIGSNFLKLKKPTVILLRSKISRIRSGCKKLAESWTGRFQSSHDSMLAFHNGRLLALHRSRYITLSEMPDYAYSVHKNGWNNKQFFIGHAIRS